MTSKNGAESTEVERLLESVSQWERLRRREDYPRLAAGIVVRETKLDKLGGYRERSWALLGEAKTALAAANVDLGWEFLNALDRELVSALTPEELAAKAASVAREASTKLDGWRREAASDLLPGSGRKRTPSRERVRETLGHLHEASQNQYRKLSRLRSQLALTSSYVAAVVLGVLVINFFGGFAVLGPQFQLILPLAVLSGALGGILSLAYSSARWDPKRKIPEVSASFSVTLVRPLVGGALAMPVAFFIESGLLAVPDGNLRIWLTLAFCFLGGISERWFLGLVRNLESS